MTVIVPQYSHNYYRLILMDSSGRLGEESDVGEFIYKYPFSDTVTLHLVCDITNMLTYYSSTIKPGEISYFYTYIRSADRSREIRLSKHLEVQNLRNIPDMSSSLTSGAYLKEGDLRKIYKSFWEMSGSSENISFSEDKDAVKDALDMMKGTILIRIP